MDTPISSFQPSKRLVQLQKLLERTPDDPFLLYGIAMEHKNAGDTKTALEFFRRVLERDSGYLYAYHQRGLTFEMLGETSEAKRSYEEGIAAARVKGDLHAAGEIEGALAAMED